MLGKRTAFTLSAQAICDSSQIAKGANAKVRSEASYLILCAEEILRFEIITGTQNLTGELSSPDCVCPIEAVSVNADRKNRTLCFTERPVRVFIIV